MTAILLMPCASVKVTVAFLRPSPLGVRTRPETEKPVEAGARAATNGDSVSTRAQTRRLAKSGAGPSGASIVRSRSWPFSPCSIRTKLKVVGSLTSATTKQTTIGGVTDAVVEISYDVFPPRSVKSGGNCPAVTGSIGVKDVIPPLSTLENVTVPLPTGF